MIIDNVALNEIYKPLHERAVELLFEFRTMGFEAKLSYYNMHETKIGSDFFTEYFPLPEIEISHMTNSADFGLSLEGGFWLELTLNKDQAAKIDYAELTQKLSVEVYGADNYLADMYNSAMNPNDTVSKILTSSEKEIHLCFFSDDTSLSNVDAVFTVLYEMHIISIDYEKKINRKTSI